MILKLDEVDVKHFSMEGGGVQSASWMPQKNISPAPVYFDSNVRGGSLNAYSLHIHMYIVPEKS